MGTSSRLATQLDYEMLLSRRSVVVVPSNTPDERVPLKSGGAVFEELGGRYLLRYLLREQVDQFLDGSEGRLHWATPTPYSPEETIRWLALPAVRRVRDHVLFLDPRRIPEIRGPRWVRLGGGIEYLLPGGFPKEALVADFPVKVT